MAHEIILLSLSIGANDNAREVEAPRVGISLPVRSAGRPQWQLGRIAAGSWYRVRVRANVYCCCGVKDQPFVLFGLRIAR